MTDFVKRNINSAPLLYCEDIGLHASKLILILRNLIQPLETNVTYKLIDWFASGTCNIKKINKGKNTLKLGEGFFFNLMLFLFLKDKNNFGSMTIN